MDLCDRNVKFDSTNVNNVPVNFTEEKKRLLELKNILWYHLRQQIGNQEDYEPTTSQAEIKSIQSSNRKNFTHMATKGNEQYSNRSTCLNYVIQFPLKVKKQVLPQRCSLRKRNLKKWFKTLETSWHQENSRSNH